MKKFKVSAKYWNSLSKVQQAAFSDLLARGHGDLQYLKRIISLVSKHFPTFAAIIPSSDYNPTAPSYLTNGVFIAIDSNDVILGTVYKGYGIGITEQVKRRENDSYTEVWHN